MRSRKSENGGRRARVRSPPWTVRDHHRSDWRPSPDRRVRFSPPREHERPHHRALGIGDHRSTSVERRDISRHFDERRDISRHFDEARFEGIQSWALNGSPHMDYPRKYFDLDIEANPSTKHIGIGSIAGGGYSGSGSSNSRAAKEKDFQAHGSSGLDGDGILVQKSMSLEDGSVRTFLTLPLDTGYSSLGLNPSKIAGSSAFPSTASSLGGNMNVGYHGDEDNRYHSRLVSKKMPAGEPFEEDEEKQWKFYSTHASYSMLPSSSLSQSKAFGSTSSGLSREDNFSLYRDSLNLQSIDGYGRSIGGNFSNPMDHNGYGRGQQLFDSANGSVLQSKDVKPLYHRGLLSPTRNESHGYSFLELDQRDKGSSGFLSDELYRKMQTSTRGDYSDRDPVRSTFSDHIRDRIDGTEISSRTHVETGISFVNHQTLQGDPVASFHDVNRESSLAMDRYRPFGSGDVHHNFVSKVSRDHDIMHYGGDYDFGRDSGLLGHKERLKSPHISDHDHHTYRLDMDAKRRSDMEDLDVYNPSVNITKRKHAIDEISMHNSRTSRPDTWKPSRRILERGGNDDHEGRVGLRPNQLGFGRPPHKIQGRSHDRSRKVTISDRVRGGFLESRRAIGRASMLKRRMKPGPSDIPNSFQFDRRQDFFYRAHKFKKGSYDERNDGATSHDKDSQEDAKSLVKTDPPEGSEEFKQQVHRAFLRFSKQLNESLSQQKRYKEQGKAGSLLCNVCGSLSKDFVDTHSLVTHAFNSLKVGLRTNHVGFHKALCVMMGWNSLVAPDTARTYQSMPADEASALKEDLILWPPLIIIHNSSIGSKNKDTRIVITNERMEEILRGMGFGPEKTKVSLGKTSNHSILVVKFMPTFSGLQEAERLHEYYAGRNRGRKEVLQITSADGNGGNEVQRENAEELFLYGYMAIAEDLDKLDFESKKRCVVKSMKEIQAIADASITTD